MTFLVFVQLYIYIYVRTDVIHALINFSVHSLILVFLFWTCCHVHLIRLIVFPNCNRVMHAEKPFSYFFSRLICIFFDVWGRSY